MASFSKNEQSIVGCKEEQLHHTQNANARERQQPLFIKSLTDGQTSQDRDESEVQVAHEWLSDYERDDGLSLPQHGKPGIANAAPASTLMARASLDTSVAEFQLWLNPFCWPCCHRLLHRLSDSPKRERSTCPCIARDKSFPRRTAIRR